MLQRARVADEVAVVGTGAAGPGVSVAEVDSVPAHCPLVHTSLIVAALPSLQLVPSACGSFRRANSVSTCASKLASAIVQSNRHSRRLGAILAVEAPFSPLKRHSGAIGAKGVGGGAGLWRLIKDTIP